MTQILFRVNIQGRHFHVIRHKNRISELTQGQPLIHRIALKLIKPMVFEIGQTFTIREGQMTLGTGVVTAVHKNLTEDERSDILGGRRRREKNARLAEQKTKKSR